ncbi:DUF748 domain-containing protein [Neptunitalea lumnitzerae]|uniref:DUF748 domain-containing protein n=1 Tax=Neptunitalea lumnitzerae TaxID=2965509 RepID=A0ABQ5MIH9_9FLAO|nr:DUF748 domain-containing protein [Neptunitalea sp. Y10]GLB49198.1 hypothetical protein Y10_15660 [Neptunitalea sp. Y10]
MSKKKKTRNIFLIIVALLLVFRLLLPTIVKNYVNNTLADLPGYYGHVEDIDIALIRGAYVIHELNLDKVNGNNNIPFLNFKKTDISIQWKSLFKGKIVSEIEMYKPTVNYILEEQQQDTIAPSNEDWTKALTDLVPIDINTLMVNNGSFSFMQLNKEPDIDLILQNINLTATNLKNVTDQQKKLPSTIKGTAVSFGEGNVSLNGRLNLLKEIPDLDLDFKLEEADVTALNDLTLAYAGIDFEKGSFDLYSEMVINDGYLKGYFKPIFTKVKILDSFKKEDSSIFKKLWEGFVGVFKFLFKNHKEDTLATNINVEGDLNNVDSSGIFHTIGGILKNAFIEAYKKDIDRDIEFENVSIKEN